MRLNRVISTHRLGARAIVLITVAVTAAAGFVGAGIGAAVSKAAPIPSGAQTLIAREPQFPYALRNVGFATIALPLGFTVVSSNSSSVVIKPATGQGRIVVSDPSLSQGTDLPALTAQIEQSERNTVDANAQLCPDDTVRSFTMRAASGANIAAATTPLCVYVIPQDGKAFAARDYFYAAVGSRSGQTTGLVVEVFAPADEFPALVNLMGGFVGGVTWVASQS